MFGIVLTPDSLSDAPHLFQHRQRLGMRVWHTHEDVSVVTGILNCGYWETVWKVAIHRAAFLHQPSIEQVIEGIINRIINSKKIYLHQPYISSSNMWNACLFVRTTYDVAIKHFSGMMELLGVGHLDTQWRPRYENNLPPLCKILQILWMKLLHKHHFIYICLWASRQN